jgi:hypothetical protein
MGLVVDTVELGHSSFLCQLSFHPPLHTHHHLINRNGALGEIVADVVPPKEIETVGKEYNQVRKFLVM